MNQREKNSGKSCANHSQMLAYASLLAIMLASASTIRAQSITPLSSSEKKAALASEYGKLPLSFEKNEGQADPGVKFLAHGQGYSLSLTRDGALLVLHKETDPASQSESEARPQLKLVGANPNAEIVGMEELPGKVNYLLGNDPQKWRTNLPTFAKVLYRDVYPGVDLVFYGNQGKLEFDFIVHPGANPKSIQLENLGAPTHALDHSGNIVCEYAGGRITLNRPFSYVSARTEKREIASNYVLQKNGRISFRIRDYDSTKTLVIDPALGYSTFLGGGTATILPSNVAVDGLGEAILVGMAGTTYPMTAGAFQTAAPPAGETYVPFVMKLNASGTALVYATFLGGIEPGPYTPYPDVVTAVAADAPGNAYLTGRANNLNFPTTANVFQSTSPCLAANQKNGVCSHAVAFVTELNPTGSGLVFSTFLGGTTATTGTGLYAPVQYFSEPSPVIYADQGQPGEAGTGIAVDSTGVYVGGITSSSDFPVTSGAAQTTLTANTWVPFVAKLSGGSLIYATYLVSMPVFPASSIVTADGFATDPSGNAYIAGRAFSSFPTTPGVLQSSFGTTSSTVGDCSYVAKMNPSGSALVYATLFGCAAPPSWQLVYTKAIAADAAGNAYITGGASGSGNPATANLPTTTGAYQTTCPLNSVPPATPSCAANAFVAEINPTGTALVYSTYLGGKASTAGFGIAVNSFGEAAVAGETVSAGANTFPTTSDAVQTSCVLEGGNCYGGFVSEMSADGSALVYSTFLSGSAGLTGATAVAVDGAGNIYVAGTTSATGFPTTAGAFDNSLEALTGGFLLELGSTATGTIAIQPTTLPAGAVGLVYAPVTFTQTGGTGTITWTESGTLPTGISFVNGVLQGTPTQSGTFPISVTATDQSGNAGTVTLSLTIGVPLPLSISPTSVPAGGVNLGYYVAFTATGGAGTVTWSATGLPTGLTFSGGVLSGVPTVAGTFQLQITATDANNNVASVSVSLFIYPGTTASISLPPCSTAATGTTLLVNFGSVAIGSSATQSVCLNNTGASTLYVDGLISFSLPTSPISIASDTCPLLGTAAPSPTNGLSAGQSCQLTFQFKPTAIATYSPSLEIHDSGGAQIVNFAAAGVAPPFASFSPTQLNFGNVVENTTVNQNVTVTNTGTGPLTLNIVFFGLAATPGFSYSQVVCGGVTEPNPIPSPLTINPTQSCTFTVQFDPPSTGPFSAGLAFGDNAGSGESNLANTTILGSTGQVVSLSGTGITAGPPPDFAISATPVTVTAGNSGPSTVTISPSNGFADAVNLSVSGTPAGVTASFNTNPVNGGSGTSTLTLGTTAATPTGTFNITVTGTDTSGSPSHSNTLSLTVNSAGGGGGGGTPACGCSKTGNYVALVAGVTPASTGASPGNKYYEVDTQSGSVNTVSVSNMPSGGIPFLTFNASTSSARVEFSPSGQYLLYEAVLSGSPGNNATVQIYNLQTKQKVYESDFSFSTIPGSGKDQYGVLGDWGFSPDSPETSFTYTYLTSSGSPQLELVHLEQPLSSGTNGVPTTISLTDIIADYAKYSPCGDALAVFQQPSSLQIDLYRTQDGNHVGQTATNLPLTDIAVADPTLAPTSQVVEDSSGNIAATLAGDSSYNLGCSSQNAPAGSNVTVQPTATWTGTGTEPTGLLPAPVTLNFQSVGSPGGQISLAESNTGTPPPDGFAFGQPAAVYYDFTEIPNPLPTSGNITICINYSGITFSGHPELFHDGSSTPLPLATSISPNPDTTNHIICALTPSLSPFAIFGATSPVSTTTALTSSVSSSVEGQALTLTAQITPSLAGTPTGTVTFSDGATLLGTGTLTTAGSASIATSLLPAGPNSITAAYSGDTYFAGSTSTALALAVTPAPLTVTANGNSRQYGAADPAFTVSYSGFVNGDGPGSLSGALICTAGDTASSPVGTYAINCSGLNSANYAITYMPGTLTITPAPLMVAANNASRPYGANNPAFTGTVTGLLNADPISATFGSSATPASPVGTYAIVPALVGAPGVLGNYTITIVNGMLNIVPETTSLSLAVSPSSILVDQSAAITMTLTAPDMIIPIDPSVLAPISVSSPLVSDILTNNGTCTPVPTSAPGIAACTITLTAVEPNGRTLNASFSGSSALVASTGNADLVVTAPLESKMSCINSDFRNVSVPGGSYLWFNSIFKARTRTKQKITISFFQSSVQFQYTDASNNLVTVNQPMPDAEIVIDPSVTSASTTFDPINNVWITTIPFDLDDAAFLTGMPWLVPAAGLPPDVEPVTWCGTFASDTADIDIGWRWAAAAYSSFSADNTTLGVKPMDTDFDNPGTNHDRAGTPENFKTFVIPGARGKGGKNYTGSYSGNAIIE